MYKIEHNIPYPGTDAAHHKFPFADLKVGESFFVPGRNAQAISNAAQWHKKRLGRDFRCVSVDGGARCWRVA